MAAEHEARPPDRKQSQQRPKTAPAHGSVQGGNSSGDGSGIIPVHIHLRGCFPIRAMVSPSQAASTSVSSGSIGPITVPEEGHRIAVLWKRTCLWYEGTITAIRAELNSRNRVDQYHVEVLYDDGDRGSHALKTTPHRLLGAGGLPF